MSETPQPPLPKLLCANWPTERQTAKARRFGEGFTWTCPTCGLVLIMEQGKGPLWHWTTPSKEQR